MARPPAGTPQSAPHCMHSMSLLHSFKSSCRSVIHHSQSISPHLGAFGSHGGYARRPIRQLGRKGLPTSGKPTRSSFDALSIARATGMGKKGACILRRRRGRLELLCPRHLQSIYLGSVISWNKPSLHLQRKRLSIDKVIIVFSRALSLKRAEDRIVYDWGQSGAIWAADPDAGSKKAPHLLEIAGSGGAVKTPQTKVTAVTPTMGRRHSGQSNLPIDLSPAKRTGEPASSCPHCHAKRLPPIDAIESQAGGHSTPHRAR